MVGITPHLKPARYASSSGKKNFRLVIRYTRPVEKTFRLQPMANRFEGLGESPMGAAGKGGAVHLVLAKARRGL